MDCVLKHLRRLALPLLLVGLATPWCPARAANQAPEIIVQEILQDKIYLDMSNELKTIGEQGPMSAGPPEFDFAAL